MKRIHCISTPRNISTALMYSFAQREDIVVVDEPFYACYLDISGKNHPGREEILNSQPTKFDEVIASLEEVSSPVFYVKNMAHHLRYLPEDAFDHYQTVMLIRDPHQLIASFSKVIENPAMEDIGLRDQFNIWQRCLESGREITVIDSGQVLKDPPKVLGKLCARLGLTFDRSMLNWTAGARAEDGIWAKYWYKNVHQSTGFAPQKTSSRPFPEHCLSLLEEATPLYEQMYKNAIKAE